MFEIDFKRVVGYVLDAPDAVDMTVHHIPEFENGNKGIVVLDVSDVHLRPVRDDTHFCLSCHPTRIGIGELLGVPVRLFQENTVHAKHIGSTGVKDGVAVYGIVDDGVDI